MDFELFSNTTTCLYFSQYEILEYKKRAIVLATAYFCVSAIIGAGRLNYCVRDGNRCCPTAHVTKTMALFQKFEYNRVSINPDESVDPDYISSTAKCFLRALDLLVRLGSTHYWAYT